MSPAEWWAVYWTKNKRPDVLTEKELGELYDMI